MARCIRSAVLAACCLLAFSARPACADPLFEQQVLFSGGDGFALYRAPAVVKASGNTILAFAQGQPSIADSGPNDIVLRRSLDGGATWQPLQTVLSHSLLTGTFGFSNSTPIYDRDTGDVFLIAASTLPGGQGQQNYIYVTKSSDNGITWSSPSDITASVRPNTDMQLNPGPGHGIQLSDGRLVIPYYTRDLNTGASSAVPRAIYSDDDGLTWQIGNGVPRVTSTGQTKPISLVEPSIVETDNGLFMTTRTRAFAPNTNRSESWSTDGGITWSTAQQDASLPDANVQGSVQRWTTQAADGTNRILLSNVAGTTAREHLVLNTSYDEAQNWGNTRTISFGLSAYSDMVASNDGTMNLLYENGRRNDPRFATTGQYQQITLARFNTQWLETPVIYSAQMNFNERSPGSVVSTSDGAVKDSSLWNLHATAVGSMVYVQGETNSGSALHLTGNGEYVVWRAADSRQFFQIDANGKFTIDALMRTMAQSGVVMGRGTVGGTHWLMKIVNGYLHLDLRDDSGNQADVVSDVQVNDGLWHRLAVGRDPTKDDLEIYVDGRLSATLADPTLGFTSLFATSDIYLGRLSDGSQQLVADIDSLRFSLASPSEVQVTSVPEPGSLLFAASAAGAMYWRRRSRGRS